MKEIEPELGNKIAHQIADLMQSKHVDKCRELQEWMVVDETAVNITEKLSSPEQFTQMCHDFTADNDCENQAKRLQKSLNGRVRRNLYYKFSSAILAAAIAVLSFVVYDHSQEDQPEKPVFATHKIGIPDSHILKPTLLRGNGQEVTLAETSEGDDFVVKGNRLEQKLNKTTNLSQEIKYNTLIVPKQFTFEVELTDGTTVMLNANSELRYPLDFSGDKREVFLKGEAFFNVKKGTKPFIVHVKNCSVKVYGTQFNINSYENSDIRTLLIEGSVGVTIAQVETKIKPNEMFSVGSNGKGYVETVDPEKYLAWRNGEIKSIDEPLEMLLRKISNWYGVEFTVSNEIGGIRITTSLDNSLSLEEVLNAIEKITGIKINKTEEHKYMIR